VDAKSFMIEVKTDSGWDGTAFRQRFGDKTEANLYAHHIELQRGTTKPMRIVPSSDAVNCTYRGGLGARELKWLEP